MDETDRRELYQQVILEHNKKPRNYRKIDNPTHSAEGFNPLCGDHLHIYLTVNEDRVINDISFEGDGCAISRASASMMTSILKGKKIADAENIFKEFHNLVVGELNPEKDDNQLGKLTIFSGIWQYPSRVKCAILCWYALKGAFNKENSVTTE